MARAPKKPSAKVEQSNLLNVLKFVGIICKDVGPINETHIYLGGHWAASSDGITTIACKIEEDIFACPQSVNIIAALSKCTEAFSITQLEKGLSIKSGKFKAIIPCIDPGLMTIPGPDEPIAIINDNLKIGLEIVAPLVNDNGQDVIDTSILLNGSSVVTTDRKVILEYWHGIDLPKGISLPKSIVKPIVQSGKKLAKLGFSPSSLTFYFEDESWIKTQLFSQKWPDIDPLLNRPSQQQPFPKDFWEGLAAIEPFGEGMVYFDAGTMRSHPSDATGASFEVAGLPKGPSFPIWQLELIKPFAETVDFFTPGNIRGSTMLTFFGPNIRGAIAGRSS